MLMPYPVIIRIQIGQCSVTKVSCIPQLCPLMTKTKIIYKEDSFRKIAPGSSEAG